MNIGDALSELRKKHHLSQEEAADKLGVTRQTISKWETNQSTPDFDKINSICNLYEVTPNELFGYYEEKQEKESENSYNTRKWALGISGGVFLYFLAVAWITVSIASFKMDPIIATAVFLGICGLATFLIVYVCIVYKKKREKEENSIAKSINECIAILITIIYFILSFTTGAWHLTWIIWIAYGLIEEIVKLLFMLKEGKYEK